MTYSSEVLADSPYAYWRLGEASGFPQDSSGNGRHANEYSLGTTRAVHGVTGLLTGDSDTAFQFNSATPTSVYGTTGLATAPAAISLEAWCNPAATQTADTRHIIAVAGPPTGNVTAILYTTSAGIPTFEVQQASGTRFSVSGSALTTGSTYHLVGTFDGTTLRLYVNGSLVATLVANPTALNVPSYFGVAGAVGGPSYFAGTVDEVAGYLSTLSATRIAAHYSAGTNAAPITGTTAGVLSAPTAALSGTVAPPVTGTVAATLALPTASLAGAATPPAITGTVGGTLDLPTGALTGNAAAPGIVTGTLAGVLNGPTAALTGTAPAPVGPVTGTVAWILSDDVTTGGVGGGGSSAGTGFDLSGAVITGGSYTADETIEPTGATASFAFPGIDLDPTKVYTFSVALEPTDVAALTASVGGTVYYDTATDPNVTLTGVGDLVQVTFTLGPGLSGTPVFTVTDAIVWSVEWDGGVTPDTQPTPDPDPVFGALSDVVVLHVVAPSVPVPTLVAGRPT